jgi:predicted membrane protein DUF2231
MSGIPLHPLVVHFPIVLAVLLPISVVGALWAVRKGATARRVWALPVALAATLTLSAWVALDTGEDQEDRVENVVGKAALHGHEEAAERFLVLAGVVTLVAAVGLAGGTVGRAARLVTMVGTLGVVVAGAQVGHSGGMLVYRHGAASAYTDPVVGGDRADARVTAVPNRVAQRDRERDDR